MLELFLNNNFNTNTIKSQHPTLASNLVLDHGELDEMGKIPAIIVGQHIPEGFTSILYDQPSYISKQLIHLGHIRADTNLPQMTELQSAIRQSVKFPVLFLSKESHVTDLKTWLGSDDLHQLSCITHKVSEHTDMSEMSIPCVNYIGIQKHISTPAAYLSIQMNAMNMIGLGNFRTNMHNAEAVIRESDAILFDVNSIRKNELTGNWNSGICGFTIEEACQIMRYIGTSPKLKKLMITGINTNSSGSDHYKIVALLFWYFLEGYEMKKDQSQLLQNSQEYIVTLDDLEEPLFFYRSNDNGSWWLKLTDVEGTVNTIACSEEDYNRARLNDIPERIIKYFESVAQ